MPATVRDVMTTDVVTVAGSAPFKEVAGLLATHGVSALPVLNHAGHVIGMVSEADLLLKQEFPHADEVGRLFASTSRSGERLRAAGRLAGNLMSTPAITIAPGSTVAQAALLMRASKVKHLPVVDGDGRLVGMVSRGDLLRVFLRDDDAILADLRRLVAGEAGADASGVTTLVTDGVAKLAGRVARRSTARTLALLARELDGVVGVDDQLSYETDDLCSPYPVV